jgi:hypothetical protein
MRPFFNHPHRLQNPGRKYGRIGRTSLLLENAEMSKRAKRLQRPLTDQEVLERVTQKAGWYFYNNLQQARRDFWKRAALGAFFAGPFASLGGVMGLILLDRAQFIPLLLGLNAGICFLFPIGLKNSPWSIRRDGRIM